MIFNKLFIIYIDGSELLCLRVKLEAFKSKGVRQCYRCQRYNHFSYGCRFGARCVKRGEDHLQVHVQGFDTEVLKLCLGAYDKLFGCPEYPKPKGSNPGRQSVPTNVHFVNSITTERSSAPLSASDFPALRKRTPSKSSATSCPEEKFSDSRPTQVKGKTYAQVATDAEQSKSSGSASKKTVKPVSFKRANVKNTTDRGKRPTKTTVDAENFPIPSTSSMEEDIFIDVPMTKSKGKSGCKAKPRRPRIKRFGKNHRPLSFFSDLKDIYFELKEWGDSIDIRDFISIFREITNES